MAEITDTYTVPTRGIGLPDYSAPKPTGTVAVGPVHTLTDVGENAVRLGSIVTFDRRGNVLWLDDFEDCNIDKWVTGAGSESEITPEAARSGSFSAKLTAPASEAGRGYIEKFFPQPRYSKIGFEISFTLTEDVRFFYMQIFWWTGTQAYEAEARYFVDTEELYIRKEDHPVTDVAQWVLIAENLNLRLYRNPFHTMKLVMDPVTIKYERLILSNMEYDISNYQVPVEIEDGYPELNFQTGIQTVVGTSIYLDDAIMTQNEPANT